MKIWLFKPYAPSKVVFVFLIFRFSGVVKPKNFQKPSYFKPRHRPSAHRDTRWNNAAIFWGKSVICHAEIRSSPHKSEGNRVVAHGETNIYPFLSGVFWVPSRNLEWIWRPKILPPKNGRVVSPGIPMTSMTCTLKYRPLFHM